MTLIHSHLMHRGLILGSNSSMFVKAFNTTRFCVGERYSKVSSKEKPRIQRSREVMGIKRE